MNTIDFSLYSFIAGASLFLADGMTGHYLDTKTTDKSAFVEVKPMNIDVSYIHAKLALKAKREEVAKRAIVKKIEMVRIKSVEDCKKNKQCFIMAQAIYFESRGESKVGKIAIGQVIQKRTKLKQFPNTIEKVVYQKNPKGVCHFSYVCQIESGLITGTIKDSQAWSQSLEFAYGVMHYKYPDYSKGADHYLNPDKVDKEPFWVSKMTQVAYIGNHKFLLSNDSYMLKASINL